MIENCMVLLSMKNTGPYLENKTGCLSNIKKKNIKYVNMSPESILKNFLNYSKYILICFQHVLFDQITCYWELF